MRWRGSFVDRRRSGGYKVRYKGRERGGPRCDRRKEMRRRPGEFLRWEKLDGTPIGLICLLELKIAQRMKVMMNADNKSP